MHDSSSCWSVGTCTQIWGAFTGVYRWVLTNGGSNHIISMEQTGHYPCMEASFSCYSVQQLMDSVANIPICGQNDLFVP